MEILFDSSKLEPIFERHSSQAKCTASKCVSSVLLCMCIPTSQSEGKAESATSNTQAEETEKRRGKKPASDRAQFHGKQIQTTLQTHTYIRSHRHTHKNSYLTLAKITRKLRTSVFGLFLDCSLTTIQMRPSELRYVTRN